MNERRATQQAMLDQRAAAELLRNQEAAQSAEALRQQQLMDDQGAYFDEESQTWLARPWLRRGRAEAQDGGDGGGDDGDGGE
jgi:hypothetical protein